MFKGITRRWILSTMLVTFLIVILIATGIIYTTVYLFNNEVERDLTSVSDQLNSVFENYKTDNSTSFTSGAQDYIENFRYKEKMEVMAINSSGRIILTSTGFSYDDNENLLNREGVVLDGWTSAASSFTLTSTAEAKGTLIITQNAALIGNSTSNNQDSPFTLNNVRVEAAVPTIVRNADGSVSVTGT